MKWFLVLIIIFSASCFHGDSKKTKGSFVGASTNILRFIPGYRSRRLKNLDFYIETESKELKRQQIEFDSRALRKKLIELDK
jgi:hypothetical protein